MALEPEFQDCRYSQNPVLEGYCDSDEVFSLESGTADEATVDIGLSEELLGI